MNPNLGVQFDQPGLFPEDDPSMKWIDPHPEETAYLSKFGTPGRGEMRGLYEAKPGHGTWDHPGWSPGPSDAHYSQQTLFSDPDDVEADIESRGWGRVAHPQTGLSRLLTERVGRPVNAWLTVGKGGMNPELKVEDPQDNRILGSLSWDHGDGHIRMVETHPQEEGRGIGTELFRHARRISERTMGIASPQHDMVRTTEGVRWSRKRMAEDGEDLY